MPSDNQSELFVWVDETDHELGTITRGEAHGGSKKIHRAVTIIVFNQDKSKLLIQQRSESKDTNPGKWSCGVGGHVNVGDTYQDAAQRELLEEIGIKWNDFKFLIKFLDEGTEVERELFQVFEVTIPEELPLTIDRTEVQATKWCKLAELKEFVQTHSFTPDTITILSKLNYL